MPLEGQAFLLGLRGQHGQLILEELGRIERDRRQLDRPRFGPGSIQQLIDQAAQVAAGPDQGLQGPAAGIRQALPLEQAGAAEHGGQRCTQLVADGSEEVILGAAGGLRLLAGPLQARLQVPLLGDVLHGAEHAAQLPVLVELRIAALAHDALLAIGPYHPVHDIVGRTMEGGLHGFPDRFPVSRMYRGHEGLIACPLHLVASQPEDPVDLVRPLRLMVTEVRNPAADLGDPLRLGELLPTLM